MMAKYSLLSQSHRINRASLYFILASMFISHASFSDNKNTKGVSERENPNTAVAFEKTKKDSALEQELNWTEPYLPIFGQAARDQGYVLPLPIGLSINRATLSEPIDLSAIRLSPTSLEVDAQTSDLVSLSPVEIESLTVRLDVWVLPFLNLYLLAGQTEGETDITINIPAISICPLPKCQFPGRSATVAAPLDGSTVGLGTTIAGGYGDFFGVLDINWTETDLDLLKDPARSTMYSARLGWNGKVNRFTGAFWVGGMVMDREQTVVIPLSAVGVDNFKIEVDVESSSSVTPLLGARWDISREWNITSELGLDERDFLLLSLGYRF